MSHQYLFLAASKNQRIWFLNKGLLSIYLFRKTSVGLCVAQTANLNQKSNVYFVIDAALVCGV